MYYPNIIDNIIFKFIYINIIILIFVYMFDFFDISRSSRLFDIQISITEYRYNFIDNTISISKYQLNNSASVQYIILITKHIPNHNTKTQNKYQINNYST